MSRGWQKSGLVYGEKLRVPSLLFVEGIRAQDRLQGAYYIGESETGIYIDCVFTPGVCTMDTSSWHYRMMIPWASIWCGHIKLYRDDDSMVNARRARGARVR